MLIPIIKVRDGAYEHVVGADSHDVLHVDQESGGIQYLNIQCQEGTKKYDGEQAMQSVSVPGYFEDAQIQFVTAEELLKAKGECQERLKDDEITDTGGALLF